MRKKVLLTATVQSHIAQFHKPLIKLLKEKNCEIHIAARNNLAEKNGLKIDDVDKIFDIPFDRSPFSKKNIQAYKQLKKLIDTEKYDVISCNTPMGGVVTRLAAKAARKNGATVIYTAHGFHFYKGAPLKNWLFYYPIEKWLSRYTDKIITINKEDFEFAKKKMKNSNIYYIHGVGVYTDRYNTDASNDSLRNELGFSNDDFIIICTGELNNNKNQKTVIDALAKLNNKKIKLMLAGNGSNQEVLKQQAVKLNIAKRVLFLGYVTDLERYVKISNIAVSMSIREGLGLNIIEAMMCGKPVIAALNRGHKDLVISEKGGFLVQYNNSVELANKINVLYENTDLCKKMREYNLQHIKPFCADNTKNELEKIYSEVLV